MRIRLVRALRVEYGFPAIDAVAFPGLTRIPEDDGWILDWCLKGFQVLANVLLVDRRFQDFVWDFIRRWFLGRYSSLIGKALPRRTILEKPLIRGRGAALGTVSTVNANKAIVTQRLAISRKCMLVRGYQIEKLQTISIMDELDQTGRRRW